MAVKSLKGNAEALPATNKTALLPDSKRRGLPAELVGRELYELCNNTPRPVRPLYYDVAGPTRCWQAGAVPGSRQERITLC